jgi:hypothetical protein
VNKHNSTKLSSTCCLAQPVQLNVDDTTVLKRAAIANDSAALAPALTQPPEHITLCVLEGLALLSGHTFGQLILRQSDVRYQIRSTNARSTDAQQMRTWVR